MKRITLVALCLVLAAPFLLPLEVSALDRADAPEVLQARAGTDLSGVTRNLGLAKSLKRSMGQCSAGRGAGVSGQSNTVAGCTAALCGQGAGAASAGSPLDNWVLRNPPGGGYDLRAAAYGAGMFAAVGDHGTILTSPD